MPVCGILYIWIETHTSTGDRKMVLGMGDIEDYLDWEEIQMEEATKQHRAIEYPPAPAGSERLAQAKAILAWWDKNGVCPGVIHGE